MPFYTGKSADGSDAQEVEGMYVNPKNPEEWSSRPYPEHVKIMNMKNDVLRYMNGKYTLQDVYEQIQARTCGLSVSRREYVLSHFDENGVFLYDEDGTDTEVEVQDTPDSTEQS